jgi:cytochrome c-type biogenesis protein CcmE
MKPKHQRLILILLGIVTLSVGTYLVLSNFNNNIIFFYSPTEFKEQYAKLITSNKRIRVGGLIGKGSIKIDGEKIIFTISDLSNDVTIHYNGIMPNLFRAGQGMVARGVIQADSSIKADELLTKHDENYMPREVVKALKDSGQWQE